MRSTKATEEMNVFLNSFAENCVASFDFVFVFKGQCLFGQVICLAFQGQTDHWRREWSECSWPFLMVLW